MSQIVTLQNLINVIRNETLDGIHMKENSDTVYRNVTLEGKGTNVIDVLQNLYKTIGTNTGCSSITFPCNALPLPQGLILI